MKQFLMNRHQCTRQRAVAAAAAAAAWSDSLNESIGEWISRWLAAHSHSHTGWKCDRMTTLRHDCMYRILIITNKLIVKKIIPYMNDRNLPLYTAHLPSQFLFILFHHSIDCLAFLPCRKCRFECHYCFITVICM